MKKLLTIGDDIKHITDNIRYIEVNYNNLNSIQSSDYICIHMGELHESIIDSRLVNIINSYNSQSNCGLNMNTDNNFRKLICFKFNKKDSYLIVIVITNKVNNRVSYEISLYL